MRVTLFLFAAIAAVLSVPAWARPSRFRGESTDGLVDDGVTTQQRASTRQQRLEYHEGYGFAPTLEPNLRAWRKQWRAERRAERLLARREAKLRVVTPSTIGGTKTKPTASSADELPPYWSFAEPGFSPPWLEQTPPAMLETSLG
jgi:hypothetical protein